MSLFIALEAHFHLAILVPHQLDIFLTLSEFLEVVIPGEEPGMNITCSIVFDLP